MYGDFKEWLENRGVLAEFLVNLEENKGISLSELCSTFRPISYVYVALLYKAPPVNNINWYDINTGWVDFVEEKEESEPTEAITTELAEKVSESLKYHMEKLIDSRKRKERAKEEQKLQKQIDSMTYLRFETEEETRERMLNEERCVNARKASEAIRKVFSDLGKKKEEEIVTKKIIGLCLVTLKEEIHKARTVAQDPLSEMQKLLIQLECL